MADPIADPLLSALGERWRELKDLPERVEQEQMTAAVQRLFHLETRDDARAVRLKLSRELRRLCFPIVLPRSAGAFIEAHPFHASKPDFSNER